MVMGRSLCIVLLLAGVWVGSAAGQDVGGVRGIVMDQDFDVPLSGARVLIAETGQQAESAAEGNYVINGVPPGAYTVIFSKAGFTRQVKANVVVNAGQLTEVDAWLSGDFTDMETVVVRDIQFGGGSEIALLDLRMNSASFLDSIGEKQLSLAGASDAAAGLRLVSGATVQDGKFAVIRGLPDRFVVSKMNGVRLPTADEDKRAVQLDQFPSTIIESIQVSKTFTPDQQGDASGGAVNIVLKGIPEENTVKFSTQIGGNTEVLSADDFLGYDGGGVNYWGLEDRDIQTDNLGQSWDGAVGVTPEDTPIDYKWSLAGGGQHEFDTGIRIGGFGSFFYEQDSSVINDGIEDQYWVEDPGAPMTPQYSQGTPRQGDFKTSLFDVNQGTEQVQWGALGTGGVEIEDHSLNLVYLYTRSAEDQATIAEDTRGKYYYFPDYDVDDPRHEGNRERAAAPFLRTETLQYTERETTTLQFSGDHKLPFPEFAFGDMFQVFGPEIDWGVAFSTADQYQPDKRQFGSEWWAPSFRPGIPPFFPPTDLPAVHRPFKPAANFTIGNLQRVWKEISEESDQFFVDVKIPFEQWTGDEGYVKAGIFHDEVTREYEQESFSNFNDNSAQYEAPFDDLWSDVFPDEDHPITAGEIDVDYTGEQKISAWYNMVDLPVTSFLNLIGGVRFESTELSIVNDPEGDVRWIPPNASGPVVLRPGDADVDFSQEDVLPSIGFVFEPFEPVTLRGSYSRTVARQTFKELSPIQQQEFLGGDVFIGNPELEMAALENYDIRLDLTPFEGSLVSFSYFHKDVKDPIEYVQRVVEFTFTTPTNYPEGTLNGFEIEARQHLGEFWDNLEGLTLGGNATLINSEVVLPDDEAALFEAPNIQAPMRTRDMTNAPERLYNLFLTYEMDELGLEGTELGLFYTVRGDTLIAGAGTSKGNFVPNVYEKEYGTLNLSLTQQIGDHWSLKFQGKNLTDPDIETVYRSRYIDGDVTKASYNKGMEFSLSASVEF